MRHSLLSKVQRKNQTAGTESRSFNSLLSLGQLRPLSRSVSLNISQCNSISSQQKTTNHSQLWYYPPIMLFASFCTIACCTSFLFWSITLLLHHLWLLYLTASTSFWALAHPLHLPPRTFFQLLLWFRRHTSSQSACYLFYVFPSYYFAQRHFLPLVHFPRLVRLIACHSHWRKPHRASLASKLRPEFARLVRTRVASSVQTDWKIKGG